MCDMSTLYGWMFFSKILQTCHRAEFQIKLNYAEMQFQLEGQRAFALYGVYLCLVAGSGGSPSVTNHVF